MDNKKEREEGEKIKEKDEDLDIEILEILESDGRASTQEISDMLDIEPEKVRERVSKLEESKVIKKYKALVDWYLAGSEFVYASIDLKVGLSRDRGYDKIAERIAGFPEVRSIRLISGEYDLQVIVRGKSMGSVSSFVAEKISPMESVRDTVTHFVLKTYKEDGEIFQSSEEDSRLDISP